MRARLQRSGLNYKRCSFDSMITRLGMQTNSASATFDTVTESFKTRYPSWKSIPQLLSYFRNENHLKREFDERVTAVRLLLGQNGQLSIMDLKNSIKTLDSVCDSLVLNWVKFIEYSVSAPVLATVIGVADDAVQAVAVEQFMAPLEMENAPDDQIVQVAEPNDCRDARSRLAKAFAAEADLSRKIDLFESFLASKPEILAIYNKAGRYPKPTESLRKWISDVVAPIYVCLKYHCPPEGNLTSKNVFVRRWSGKLKFITKFGDSCCRPGSPSAVCVPTLGVEGPQAQGEVRNLGGDRVDSV